MSHRRARWAALLAASFLLASLGAASQALGLTARELGETKRTPEPACPEDCRAVGSVTGFQARAGGERQPFVIREPSLIVAWAVQASRPTASQREFFGETFRNNAFGKRPSAQLAVLRKVDRGRFRLVRRSPAMDLGPFLGEKHIFTLGEPLRVRRGHVVALTVPTWLSNLAFGPRADGDTWRASRRPDRCADRFATEARPQGRLGSTRVYGCKFDARLLYWAYVVPRG